MLTNPTPIETPAVAAKVYDKLHLYSLTAIQPTGDDGNGSGSGSITVELLPATADGELATGDKVQRMSPARFTPRLPKCRNWPQRLRQSSPRFLPRRHGWLLNRRLWTMSNTVTLTEEQAKLVMQALDLAVKTGGLNAAAAILPVASAIEQQLTSDSTLPAPSSTLP
jgi:hypothetical protein